MNTGFCHYNTPLVFEFLFISVIVTFYIISKDKIVIACYSYNMDIFYKQKAKQTQNDIRIRFTDFFITEPKTPSTIFCNFFRDFKLCGRF